MLKTLRKKIDKIDKKITKLLIKRYDVVKEVAEVKRKNDIPVEDKKREDQCLKSLIEDQNLDNDKKKYLNHVISSIHKESKKIQKQVK